MTRRQSPSPMSVNIPSHWYLKSQPIRATLFFQCDGEAISLPNLQGIVVLNITSYAGGVNFWGSSTATTVSMEQGMRREKILTPLKSVRKESWTDWSVGEKEAGWGPLLAAAVWRVFLRQLPPQSTRISWKPEDQINSSVLHGLWIFHFSNLTDPWKIGYIMTFSLRMSVNKISWEIGHESFPLSSPKKAMRPGALGIYDAKLDREGTS